MESSDNENHATKFVNDLEIIEEKAAAEGEVGGGGGGIEEAGTEGEEVGGEEIEEVEGEEQEKAEGEGEGEKAGGEEGKKVGGEEEQEKAEGEAEGEGEGENNDEDWRYTPLLKAALKGDWDSSKRFLDQDPDALTANITLSKETALHIAVKSGRSIEFVKELVDMMPAEALALRTTTDSTALQYAAWLGNTKAAVILVDKHPASLYMRDTSAWLPLHSAAGFGHKC